MPRAARSRCCRCCCRSAKTLTHKSRLRCVFKELTPAAQQLVTSGAVSIDDVEIAIDVNGVPGTPLPLQAQPTDFCSPNQTTLGVVQSFVETTYPIVIREVINSTASLEFDSGGCSLFGPEQQQPFLTLPAADGAVTINDPGRDVANISCAFTNSALGSIGWFKSASPQNDGTAFPFTLSGPGLDPAFEFILDDDDSPDPPVYLDNVTRRFLSPGGYDLTETLPAGWGLDSIDCGQASTAEIDDGGDLVGVTVTLAEGENVVCTFDNIGPGSIGWFKSASPRNDGTNFEFTLSGGDLASPFEFILDDDDSMAEPVHLDNITRRELGPGVYTLTEAVPAGWGLDSVDCVDQQEGVAVTTDIADGVTISLAQGQNVVCTFDNVELPHVLVCVAKELGPRAQSLGFTDPSAFTFSMLTSPMLPVPATTSPDCPNGTAFKLAPGAPYRIFEEGPDDSADTIGISSQLCGDVPPAEDGTWTAPTQPTTVNCVITNEVGQVCIEKRLGSSASVAVDISTIQMFVTVDGGTEQQVAMTDSECGGTVASTTSVLGHINAPPGATIVIREANVGISRPQPTNPPCTNRQPFDDRPVVFSPNPGVLDAPNLSITGVVVPNGSGAYAYCRFANDVAIVCVKKSLGNTAEQVGFTTSNFTFTLTTGPADDPVVVQPLAVASNESPCEAGETPFALLEGTAFTVNESETGVAAALAGKSGIVNAFDACSLANGVITGTAPTDGSPATCTVRNDVLLICITKELGAGAQAAGILPTAATFYVQFPSEDEISLTPSTTTPTYCEPPSTGSAVAELLRAPTSPSFTIREDAPANTGFVRGYCPQGEGAQPPPDQQSTQPITILTSGDAGAGTYDCIIVNDSVIVCAAKELGTNAQQVGKFSTSDFPLTLRSQMTEVTAVTVDRCQGAAYPVAPGARFELTETIAPAAAAEIALVGGFCSNGTASDALANGIAWNAPSDLTNDGVTQVNCSLTNDSAVVCVVKGLTENGQAAVDAGAATISDVGFTLAVDGGSASTAVAPAAVADDSSCGWVRDAGAGVAAFVVAPATDFVATEELAASSVLAPVFAQCGSTSASASLSLSFTSEDAQPGEVPYRYLCRFINSSVPLTITKTVVNDDDGVATASDFLFDVFAEDGSAAATGISPATDAKTAPVYVKPGSMVTVAERPFDGYTTTANSCPVTAGLDQALEGSTTFSFDVPIDATAVDCTFTNDDIPLVPVCAMLTFDEGNSGLTLDAFTLEVFDGGALVGSKVASAAGDAACAEPTEIVVTDDGGTSGSAGVLPGNVVLVGQLLPDGRTISFVASVNDPANVVVFDASSCMVDTPTATQTLRSADAVSVAITPGATRVLCLASARAVERVSIESLPSIAILPTEPTPESVAAAPQPEGAVQSISLPLAVTGASTTDTGLPFALSLIGIGFAIMAGYHHSRRGSSSN